MTEVNLSNMLFGDFVIEAIDFTLWLPSSVLKDRFRNTHSFVNVEFNLLMNLSWWHISIIWYNILLQLKELKWLDFKNYSNSPSSTLEIKSVVDRGVRRIDLKPNANSFPTLGCELHIYIHTYVCVHVYICICVCI